MKSLLVLAFLFLTVSAWAETAEQRAARLESIRQKVEKEEKTRRQILSALYEINRKMRRTVSKTAKLEIERKGVEENLRRVEEHLRELEQVSEEMKMRLAERLRVLHRLGGASMARILFSSGSSSQLERNLKILGAISTRDREAIQDYQKNLDEIRKRRERLAERRNQLRNLSAELEKQKQQLAKDQGLKQKLLKGVQKKHLFALKDLQKLKEQTRRAGFEDTTLLDSLLRPSFFEQRGQLPTPISNGQLVRTFGVEKAGENSWMIMNKGLRWAAPKGSPVQAVFSGRVAWVGRIGEQGETVILDHGDHYYTVYSELTSVRVEVGQEVQAQEILAAVGGSHLEDQAGLHFEIRHFSEPDDPQQWMKGTIL